MIFNKWVKYVEVNNFQKIKRIRELNVMIALMEMKYKKITLEE